jgi:hypothetical protein
MKMHKRVCITSNACHEFLRLDFEKDVSCGIVIAGGCLSIPQIVLNSIVDVRQEAKHDVVFPKKAALLQGIHVSIFLVKQLNSSFLNHIKVFNFLS